MQVGAPTAAPPPELAAALDALGLLADRDDAEQAGTHRMEDHYFTAFRGLLTVADHQDRPAHSGVYLGFESAGDERGPTALPRSSTTRGTVRCSSPCRPDSPCGPAAD